MDSFLLIGSIYCYRKLSCYLNQVCHTELKNTYRYSKKFFKASFSLFFVFYNQLVDEFFKERIFCWDSRQRSLVLEVIALPTVPAFVKSNRPTSAWTLRHPRWCSGPLRRGWLEDRRHPVRATHRSWCRRRHSGQSQVSVLTQHKLDPTLSQLGFQLLTRHKETDSLTVAWVTETYLDPNFAKGKIWSNRPIHAKLLWKRRH